MSPSLPERPDIDHLKNEAKSILKAHRAKDSSCCSVLRVLPRLKRLSDQDLLATHVSLQQVQHALALQYGFARWKALVEHVEQASDSWQHRLEDWQARLRHDNRKVRIRALREAAVCLHPNWTGGTPFGWGLAFQAAQVPKDIKILTDLVEDASWRIRREAVCALAAYRGLSSRTVETALQRTLTDCSHAVQHAAARVLTATCPGCETAPTLSQYVS